MEDGIDHCQENGLGYCMMTGQLIPEIPCKEGSYETDWVGRVDFDKLN